MNLVQLKYFLKVCECGSVSGAAKALFISQPSLSGAIKELEAEFGVVLFKRHHHGVTLTNEGRELLKYGEGLLSHSEQVHRVMYGIGNGKKCLRLGVPPMIGALVLPQIYNNFVPYHNDIDLEITEAGRSELVRKLEDNLADMVFLPHNTPFDPEFASFEAARLEIVFCTYKGNPLSLLPHISPTDLCDVPIVLFGNSFFQTEELRKWFDKGGVNPNILMQTEQLSTLINLISGKAASGFMFRRLIREDSELCALPLKEPMFVKISLVWKKNDLFLGCMKSFLDFVKTTGLDFDGNNVGGVIQRKKSDINHLDKTVEV